ncbi:TasA family protein [Pseudoflavonifractor sp. HCP28S3_F10]|uniref:TasA family protein n=1 Tax=Pseudoflavonifractor sp. HCP28S3_F10 TaxID=3438947 RepID=UPI003F8C5E0F
MKKKIMAAALAICMMATLVVGMSLAYFTDKEEKSNVFTIGNVDITLTEPNWDASGKEEAKEAYPGEPLAKDPTVENTGANPCFVRIKVEWDSAVWGNVTPEYRTGYQPNTLGAGWVDGGDGYFYFTKPLCVKGTENDSWNVGLVSKTPALFDQIVIPTSLTNSNAQTEYTVKVTAQAIQAQGAKAPNWAAVKGMTLPEIQAWFGQEDWTPAE